MRSPRGGRVLTHEAGLQGEAQCCACGSCQLEDGWGGGELATTAGRREEAPEGSRGDPVCRHLEEEESPERQTLVLKPGNKGRGKGK